jgi:hypothetical protein
MQLFFQWGRAAPAAAEPLAAPPYIPPHLRNPFKFSHVLELFYEMG